VDLGDAELGQLPERGAFSLSSRSGDFVFLTLRIAASAGDPSGSDPWAGPAGLVSSLPRPAGETGRLERGSVGEEQLVVEARKQAGIIGSERVDRVSCRLPAAGLPHPRSRASAHSS